MQIKVLNLYAGIGGNRKLWQNVNITAVELNESVAKIYSDLYANDTVIVGDAHEYLLKHYNEFDFIWSSPPCQSHSRARYWAFNGGKTEAIYPDMKLYEEILFLKHYSKAKWVVENVIPYYKPLLPGIKVGRHLYWSNFNITQYKEPYFPKDSVAMMQELYGFDLGKYKINKTRLLRNCVYPGTGLHIFNCAFYSDKQKEE